MGRSPLLFLHTARSQVYLVVDVDARNAKFLALFGNLCSAVKKLPASAVLSTGLTKCGNIAIDSGGLTDIWRGDHQGARVAIKTFRTHSAQNFQEAIGVRIECT